MINKIFRLYILFIFFFTAGVFVFADKPSDKQAKEDYTQAVELYKNKKLAKARKKFEEVNLAVPGYKDTMKYLGVIDRYVREKQEKALQGQRQRQAQLETRRKAVRKQLEDGVEAIYQKALSLYKQGDYKAATDKFKDVQDILSGYKSAGQYVGEARLKSLTVNPPSPSLSRQDSVSKALDLFESNAK